MTLNIANYVVEYKEKDKWTKCISYQHTPFFAKEHAKNIGVKKYRIIEIIEETKITEKCIFES